MVPIIKPITFPTMELLSLCPYTSTYYIDTFGKLSDDPYQIALTSILERTLLQVEALPQIFVHTYIEGRGKKEDRIVM